MRGGVAIARRRPAPRRDASSASSREGRRAPRVGACVVRTSRGELRVRARAFVLATGGIENARLLLVSRDCAPRPRQRARSGRPRLHEPPEELLRHRARSRGRSTKLPYYFGCLHHGFAGYAGLRLAGAVQRERGLLNSYVALRAALPLVGRRGRRVARRARQAEPRALRALEGAPRRTRSSSCATTPRPATTPSSRTARRGALGTLPLLAQRRAARAERRAVRLVPPRPREAEGPPRAPAQLPRDGARAGEPRDARRRSAIAHGAAAAARASPLRRARPPLAGRAAPRAARRAARERDRRARGRPRARRALADRPGRLAPHGRDAHGRRSAHLGRRPGPARARRRERLDRRRVGVPDERLRESDVHDRRALDPPRATPARRSARVAVRTA